MAFSRANVAFCLTGVPSSADSRRSSARSCSSVTRAKSQLRSSTVTAFMAAVASSVRGDCPSLAPYAAAAVADVVGADSSWPSRARRSLVARRSAAASSA